MQDDSIFPTAAELERFREDITRELRLTRKEARRLLKPPLAAESPASGMLEHIAMLEERIRELDPRSWAANGDDNKSTELGGVRTAPRRRDAP